MVVKSLLHFITCGIPIHYQGVGVPNPCIDALGLSPEIYAFCCMNM